MGLRVSNEMITLFISFVNATMWAKSIFILDSYNNNIHWDK